MKVKEALDAKGIENFIPMQYKLVTRNGRRVKRLVPSIHNLLFMLIEPDKMREFKAGTDLPIRYIMDRETNRPIVIPTRQMKSFIAVAGTYDEQLIYLDGDPAMFNKGDRVRVLGGAFEGAEGRFVRVKGDRRVVVSIPGVVAVATMYIHPSLIEKITD